jgi:hypothetical protein
MACPIDGDGAEASLDPESHTAFDIRVAVRWSRPERRIIGNAYDRIRSRV